VHKSRLAALVIDCETRDLEPAAAFWAAALGLRVDPHRPSPKYIRLAGPDGEIRVLIQSVEHPARVHLDIESDDKPAEVARLTGLGAKRIGAIERWVVMEAPTGHRFCVVNPQRPDLDRNGNVWDGD